ncbi:hypothetical protein Metal_0491 [Methylomicrobium album BG8]|uniref:Uncharacterized protein n=1 Tax=Methylomicrobium album BG8 TaxID=686340 RepID=H8GNB3_METAL|nr:hypothetical protein Metal_0491 [Methylomicrobium album BG8]
MGCQKISFGKMRCRAGWPNAVKIRRGQGYSWNTKLALLFGFVTCKASFATPRSQSIFMSRVVRPSPSEGCHAVKSSQPRRVRSTVGMQELGQRMEQLPNAYPLMSKGMHSVPYGCSRLAVPDRGRLCRNDVFSLRRPYTPSENALDLAVLRGDRFLLPKRADGFRLKADVRFYGADSGGVDIIANGNRPKEEGRQS